MTRVLLVGFDPAAIPGQDATAVEPAFAQARRQAADEHLELVECLVAPDESAVPQIESSLAAGTWDCVVIGGGIRKPEPALELFEYVVNLVRRRAPAAAIAFNTSPADTVDAALRALAGA